MRISASEVEYEIDLVRDLYFKITSENISMAVCIMIIGKGIDKKLVNLKQKSDIFFIRWGILRD